MGDLPISLKPTEPSSIGLGPKELDVVAQGLQFAEGPVALADGSVIVVDVLGGRILQAMTDGTVRIVAQPGGGPNGAAMGPDGRIYVVNNGGFAWEPNAEGQRVSTWEVPRGYTGGWIDRVDLATGAVERLLDNAGGHRLSGPNDIVFDRTGGFWFTDTGKTIGRVRRIGGAYYVPSGCSDAREVIFGATSFNGIGLSKDENTLYIADTKEATLWAYALAGPGVLDRLIAPRPVVRHPGAIGFDSLALQDDGCICVGMVGQAAGIAIISPDGGLREVRLPDPFVTNICFGGADRRTAFVTLAQSGRLIRLPWDVPGLALNFTEYR